MTDSSSVEVLRRLDLILGTIQLAHLDAIERARKSMLADPVTRAVYELTEDWIAGGQLTSSVAVATSVTTRTVRSRVAELAERRVLEVSGAGPSIKYRRTGLL